MIKDPVCNMEVDEEKAVKAIYKEKTYYFCSSGCKSSFEKNPEQFIE